MPSDQQAQSPLPFRDFYRSNNMKRVSRDLKISLEINQLPFLSPLKLEVLLLNYWKGDIGSEWLFIPRII